MLEKKESTPRGRQWQALYKLAAEFYRTAPWEWLWDRDLIAVSDPISLGDYLYCSVMGRNKEHFAIGAYIGSRGFQGLRDLFGESNKDFESMRAVEMIQHQYCIKISFELPEDTADCDRQRAKEYGWTESNRLPEFYSYVPGFAPWTLSQEDAARLIVVIEQVLLGAERLAENPSLIQDVPVTGRIYARTRSAAGGEELWQDEIISVPDPMPAEPWLSPAFSTSAKQYGSLLEDMAPLQSTWLVDIGYSVVPVDSRPHIPKPYFPRVILFAADNGNWLHNVGLLEQHHGAAEVIKMFLTACQRAGGRPAMVVVQKEELYHLFREVFSSFGIEVKLVDSLPEINAVWADLDEHFGSK